jgi:hypothetical protein
LGFTKTLNISKMPLLNMYSTVSPISGLAIPGGSAVLVTYNTDNINWPTLEPQTNPENSQFEYTNANGTIGIAKVNHATEDILDAASAVTVP